MRIEVKTIGFMSKSPIPIMIEPINKTAPKDNAKTKVNVKNALIPYPNSNQVSTIPVLVMVKFFNAVCLRLFWLRYSSSNLFWSLLKSGISLTNLSTSRPACSTDHFVSVSPLPRLVGTFPSRVLYNSYLRIQVGSQKYPTTHLGHPLVSAGMSFTSCRINLA
jgi:hypothetical protein